MGMGGVQRVYNIPKVLKKLGWDVDIYTTYSPFSYPKDHLSFKLDDLNIIRSFCPDPLHIIPGKIANPRTGKRDYLSFPDNKISWLPFLWRKIKSADIIVVTCPPFSLLLPLLSIKDTAFVIDYRDQWTGSYLGKYHFKAEEALAKKIEKLCIDRASAVVTVTKKIGDHLKKQYPGSKNKIHLIRNGFDMELFLKTYKRKRTDKLTLTYMGSFNDTFKPNIIFEGLKKLFSLKPALREKIAFKYIGPSITNDLKEKARNIGLKNFITTGYLPHIKAINELTKSDLLILIGGSGEEDNWLIPGKLYQYLPSGIPILAITKNKEIKELIGSSGITCDPEPESFASSIIKIIQKPHLFKSRKNYSVYSWKELGREYSELLKDVLYFNHFN